VEGSIKQQIKSSVGFLKDMVDKATQQETNDKTRAE
jgi:hypothetical protein